MSAFVNALPCVHRIPHNVRDDRDTPLKGRRDDATREVIWVEIELNIFSEGAGQVIGDLPVGRPRNRFPVILSAAAFGEPRMMQSSIYG